MGLLSRVFNSQKPPSKPKSKEEPKLTDYKPPPYPPPTKLPIQISLPPTPQPPPNHSHSHSPTTTFTTSPTPEEDKHTFLLHLTANNRHTSRPFYDHLLSVSQKLATIQPPLSQAVIDAGLYHSIYGTEFYEFNRNGEVSRNVVKNLIGEYAEVLVWVFCTARPRWESLCFGDFGRLVEGLEVGELEGEDEGDGEVEKRRKKKKARRMQMDLCWIEIANLGDQNEDGRYDFKIGKLKEVLERLGKEEDEEKAHKRGLEGDRSNEQ